ncbi:hypothetical protein CEXT_330201 [Caerostris extrusa]|uniref:Uncharacterized protein n=1 Tax=Caerostris extrusa TaxID=172846 RepID=A0AAV4SGG2_CAEEX|nr:hypothetical protein CEXT_330201 [Caerostris extrusa]
MTTFQPTWGASSNDSNDLKKPLASLHQILQQPITSSPINKAIISKPQSRLSVSIFAKTPPLGKKGYAGYLPCNFLLKYVRKSACNPITPNLLCFAEGVPPKTNLS